jgi:hypothetical protein
MVMMKLESSSPEAKDIEGLVDEHIGPLTICAAKPVSKALDSICSEITTKYQKLFPEWLENLDPEEASQEVERLQQSIAKVVNEKFLIISETRIPKSAHRADEIVVRSRDKFKEAYEDFSLSGPRKRDAEALLRGYKINKCIKYLALKIVDAKDEGSDELTSKLEKLLEEVVDRGLEIIKSRADKIGREKGNSRRIAGDLAIQADDPEFQPVKFKARDWDHPGQMRSG